MPQITCPNCGTTINLENRRELDFTLIRNATDKRPRTFTELLRITKLPRKTLNLRLKQLCTEGILMKEEGMYKSNGASGVGNDGGSLVKGLSRAFDDKRVRTGLILVVLLVCFSGSGYVLAMMMAPKTIVAPAPAPRVLGYFTMDLDIHDVTDLYGWQAAIVFNPSQVKVVEADPGSFLKAEYPFFVNSTSTADGLLLLYGSLSGDVHGVTGTGTLASIVFEYYVNNYELPSIADQKAGFDTWIKDSSLANIPDGLALLTLNVAS
jgi:hypothetical protein